MEAGGGRCSQRRGQARPVLGSSKKKATLHLPAASDEFIKRPSQGLFHRPAGVFNTTSLCQGSIFGAASRSKKGKWKPCPKGRGGARGLQVPGPSSRVRGCHGWCPHG